MELRDKNGLTEREFLASYNADKYPKPSLTADILVFSGDAGGARLLLIRRGGHPFLGCFALPGGFANRGETLEQSAARELWEETGVRDVPLTLVGVYSRPGRDPRGWVVSAAYAAVTDTGAAPVRAGDDAADAAWFDVAFDKGADTVTLRRGSDVLTISGGVERGAEKRLAFDHAEIIASAVRKLY